MIDDAPGESPGVVDRFEGVMGAEACVEWMEFNPIRTAWRGLLVNPAVVGDETERLLIALREINAPTSIEAGWVRVWGYLRPGVAPAWVIPQPRTP